MPLFFCLLYFFDLWQIFQQEHLPSNYLHHHLLKPSTVSASSKFASAKTSSSKPSPFIIMVLFNSFAKYSARSLSFSTILTLTESKVSSIFFAKLKPILPPPIIKIFFEIFSS